MEEVGSDEAQHATKLLPLPEDLSPREKAALHRHNLNNQHFGGDSKDNGERNVSFEYGASLRDYKLHLSLHHEQETSSIKVVACNETLQAHWIVAVGFHGGKGLDRCLRLLHLSEEHGLMK